MIWQKEVRQMLDEVSLGKRAWQGGGLAFVMISVFILIANRGKLHDELWLLAPLSSVTIGGTFGGIFYALADGVRAMRGWKRGWIIALSILVYCVILYFSLIFALALTGRWD